MRLYKLLPRSVFLSVGPSHYGVNLRISTHVISFIHCHFPTHKWAREQSFVQRSGVERSKAERNGAQRSAAGERVSDYFPPNSSIWALWTHSASVCRSISHFLFLGFRRFVSGFCITVPLQPQATAAVLYTAPPTAHTLYFDAPAQHPRLCQLVCLALFQYSF